MDFEFKHIVFLTAILCAAWAIAVSSMVAYEDYTDDVALKSEMSGRAGIPSPFQFLNKVDAVTQTLNVVLPLGMLCIGFLIYTYRTNPIGGGSMLILLPLFFFASISSIDAAESVVVHEADESPLAQIVWWMPQDGGA